MNFKLFQETLTATRTKLALSTLFLGGSLLLNLILASAVIMVSGKDRIVVVPPNINKTFWVDNQNLSEEYLEQMASYLSFLALNVNPVNVDSNHASLLTYVAPEDVKKFTDTFRVSANQVKNEKIEQTFHISGYEINARQKWVAVSGNLNVSINGKTLSTGNAKFLFEFVYIGGKIYLKTFTSQELPKTDETVAEPNVNNVKPTTTTKP